LAELIRSRAISSVEVVAEHLERIEQINPSLNAVVTLADDAVDRARAADIALSKGETTGPLHGVPLTVKDTIDTQGIRTTSGTRIRAHRFPEQDASVVARLKAAGAIILGKTNVPEMAIPYETDNPVFGRTNNPHDLKLTPGGSSGGEAAAIAACLSPGGVGSDLSGSIRVPAHFCGIAGLKPTTGRVPMDGHTPEAIGALSLGACIGPMARTVEDLDLLFDCMADSIPSTSSDNVATLRGFQLAYYTYDGVIAATRETERAVKAAARTLEDAGLRIKEECPPGVTHGSRLWVELFSYVAFQQLVQFYHGRRREAGPQISSLLRKMHLESNELKDKINVAETRAKAVIEREHLREQLLHWMKTTPLILAPVGSTPAFEHGKQRVKVSGQSISIFRAFGYSQAFNVFGLPSVVVPAGRSPEGLPIGVQIIGQPFEEQTVLAAAKLIEEALGGSLICPPN
jgi:amidase